FKRDRLRSRTRHGVDPLDRRALREEAAVGCRLVRQAMKVAIIGASGFVGTAVVEHLRRRGVDAVALVGSTGNSWQHLRRGMSPRVLNVLDRAAVERHLADCSHVVNCLRGADDVMLKGLENLLATAAKNRCQRFVHLSSVAVYGDSPSPAAADESAPTAPSKGSYGWVKLQQDDMVQRAAKNGLPGVILCPPNIFGPASYFLVQLLDALIKKEFVLIDDQDSICATVDVANLAEACSLALESGVVDGRRLFVTDDELVTWPRLVARLTRAAQLDADVPTCSAEALKRMQPKASAERSSLWRSAKHLVSSDVRQALRKDANIARLDSGLRSLVAKLGSSVEDRIRLSVEGPLQVR